MSKMHLEGHLAARLPRAPERALGAWLRRAWSLRNAGSVLAAAKLYGDECLALGLDPKGPVDDLARELRKSGYCPRDVVDFLLLEVSFLRHALRVPEAADRLRAIVQVAETSGVTASFSLAFQAGLNELVVDARHQALQHFNDAAALATTDQERISARFNAVLCLEDLGFPFEATLAALEREFEPRKRDAWAHCFVHQYDALRIRSAFRAADIPALTRLAKSHGGGDQAVYHLAFIGQLPTLELPDAEVMLEQALTQLGLKGSDGYQNRYEALTLVGAMVPEDLSPNVRTSEQIERLYLWTWRWLVAPTPEAIDKVVRLRDHMLRLSPAVLSRDEFLLLGCSLRWLALFLGLPRDGIDQLLAPRQKGASAVPILDYETILLDYLHARRDGDPSGAESHWQRLVAHPLDGRRGFSLPRLARCIHDECALEGALAPLAASLKLLDRSPASDAPGLHIDLRRQTVTVRGKNAATEVHSETLCHLLDLYASGEQVCHVSTLLQRCYGLPRYDDFRHAPKIAKLLHAANQACAPYLRFQRRGDLVLRRGSLERVHRHGATPHFATLNAHRAARDGMLTGAVEAARPSDAAERHRPLACQDATTWITRRQLEAMLGLSKTAVVNQIAAWLEAGLLERHGAGKACRYLLTAELKNMLLSRSDETSAPDVGRIP